MNVEDRLELVRQVGEEIVTEDELRALLEAKPHPVCYDGFEPSGRIHIAQGVLRAINVNKMTKAGCTFKMFVADWHAWANNKMGGDLDKIQTVGKYFVEVWRAAGMDLDHVKFVWASEFVTDEAYWKKVMNIARDSSLDRVLRTTQIMGRSEKDKLSASQILYPCMQAADIFHLEADITQLGMDQRKVNMLAREVAPKYGYAKPVVVSHHMLMGLQAPPGVKAKTPEEVIKEAVGPVEVVLSTSTGRAKKWAQDHITMLRDSLLISPEDHRKMRAESERAAAGLPHGVTVDDEMRIREILSAADQSLVEKLDFSMALSHEFADVQDQSLGRTQQLLDAALRIVQEQDRREAIQWELDRISELRVLMAIRRSTAIINASTKTREASIVERATAMKMSKSNPDSAIFMTDSPADVERKMKNAYCPQKQVEENPVLEYFQYIIFQRHWANAQTGKLGESPVTVERPEKFGGNVNYGSYQEIAADFEAGKLHPMDAKKAAARYVNEILRPVREHFEKNERARALKERVDSWQVTR